MIRELASSGVRRGQERREIELRERVLVTHGVAAMRGSLLRALESFPKGGVSVSEFLSSLVGRINPLKHGEPNKRIEALQAAVRELARNEAQGNRSFWPTGGSLQDLLECSAAIIRAKKYPQKNNFQITS
jgi:hypothetical protein